MARTMVTEFAVFAVIVVGAGWLAAKLYEWRQDALYGTYIAPDHDRVCHHEAPESDVGLEPVRGESAAPRSTTFSI